MLRVKSRERPDFFFGIIQFRKVVEYCRNAAVCRSVFLEEIPGVTAAGRMDLWIGAIAVVTSPFSGQAWRR
jgi:hypothetical protein